MRSIIVQPLPNQPAYPSRTRPSTRRGRMAPSPVVPQPSPQMPQPSQEMPQPYQEMPQQTTESDEGLDIVLSVGGHPAAVVLDGWQRTASGLELIDGKSFD